MNIESLAPLPPTPPQLQLALEFWMLIYLWKIEKKNPKKQVTHSKNPKNQWCCCF
jgi:hypothetical protein